MDQEQNSRALILLLLLLLFALSGCSRGKVESSANPAVPVQVATVVQKTVPMQVRTIGTGEAYSTVSIKAQVSGELTGVHFREGLRPQGSIALHD